MALPDLETRVISLLKDNEAVGIPSITNTTAAKTLHVQPSRVLLALQELVKRGVVEYAPKHPASRDARFRMAIGGRTS